MMKILVLLLFLPFFVISQQSDYQLTSVSKKAITQYKKAEKAFLDADRAGAEKYLTKAVKADSRFIEAWLLLGDVYSDLAKFDKAVASYEKAIYIDPDFFPPVYYFLGRIHYQFARYELSELNLTKFLQFQNISPEMHSLAGDMLQRAVFARQAVANPVDFNPVNLGPSVNSSNDEYMNAIRLDGDVLLFTRKLSGEDNVGGNPVINEYFFTCYRSGDVWLPASEMITNWLITDNMGALTMSADGRRLYFSACGWPKGYGSCDIYESNMEGIQWSEPVNMGNWINSGQWDSQPSISADGKEMIFVSNRNGGTGGSDLWMSLMLPDNRWSRPVNLGSVINTTGNEMAPFLHPDGKTLYFSSTGHIGLGGADLFVSRRDESGRWGTPVNLGYPINTSGDEINIVVDASGKQAYISAIREGGLGGFDIYSFELETGLRPMHVSYVRAVVSDATNGLKLKADFEITDLNTTQLLISGQCALPEGSFLAALPSGKDYGLHVRHKGYVFYSGNFALKDESEISPYLLNIALNPIRSGASLVLRNVFFDHNQSVIRPESVDELSKLVTFLNENPMLRIELSGHTDNSGDEAYNKILSGKRAEAVLLFLQNRGIAEKRLSATGYGSAQPIGDNETEEGRAENRRTEMKIID